MGQRLDWKQRVRSASAFAIADRGRIFLHDVTGDVQRVPTGTVAYHPGGQIGQFVWADRNGNEMGSDRQSGDYDQSGAAVSRRNAVAHRTQPGRLGTYDIVQIDVARGTQEQLTWNRGSELTPVWIDGERSIVYAARQHR